MSAYKSYMDRQSVSSDLHRRLLELEHQPRKSQKLIPWGRYMALAACLCVVVGLGWFVWAMSDLNGMDAVFVSEDSSTAVMEEAAEDTAVEENTVEEFWDSDESAVAEEEETETDITADMAEDSAEEETATEDAPWLLPGWLPDGYSLTERAETEDGYTLLWTDGAGGELTLTWHGITESCPETALAAEVLAETDWTEAVREDEDGVSVLELLCEGGWLELTFTGDGETLWSVINSLWP
ncbi:MAG: hypothetical protein LIO51_01160 [Clostridiales bacterium]|nr:hypothetical protein [Clostridiales bacterium]